MSYNKGSFDTFKASLREGKYESATGARRAIGKLANLSADEKEKARKLVDQHFGESASTSVKAKPAAKPAAKAAAKPVGRQPKAVSAAPVARKPVTRQPRAAKPSTLLPPSVPSEAAEMDELRIGERVVASATAAISSLQNVANQFPEIDNRGAIQDYSSTLGKAVGIFRRVVSTHVGEAEAHETHTQSDVAPVQGLGEPAPYFPELTGGAHA